MGKGDKKTKRGKIIQGSYGVTRKPARKVAAEKNNRRKANVVAGSEKVKAAKVVAEVEVTESAEEVLAKATKKKTAAKSTKKAKDNEVTPQTEPDITIEPVAETPESTIV